MPASNLTFAAALSAAPSNDARTPLSDARAGVTSSLPLTPSTVNDANSSLPSATVALPPKPDPSGRGVAHGPKLGDRGDLLFGQRRERGELGDGAASGGALFGADERDQPLDVAHRNPPALQRGIERELPAGLALQCAVEAQIRLAELGR